MNFIIVMKSRNSYANDIFIEFFVEISLTEKDSDTFTKIDRLYYFTFGVCFRYRLPLVFRK